MSVHSKSLKELGAKIHDEFIGRQGAVLPIIQTKLALPANQGLVTEVSKQWGIKEMNVIRSLKSITGVSSTDLPHQEKWVFLLRTAQCAALSNYRLEARLASLKEQIKDPRMRAAELMHTIGTKAISLLEEDVTPDFDDRVKVGAESTRAKVEELGFTPMDFATSMGNYAERVRYLGSASGWLYANQHDSLQVAYRIITAAAVIGHELQVEFVPFDYSAGEAGVAG